MNIGDIKWDTHRAAGAAVKDWSIAVNTPVEYGIDVFRRENSSTGLTDPGHYYVSFVGRQNVPPAYRSDGNISPAFPNMTALELQCLLSACEQYAFSLPTPSNHGTTSHGRPLHPDRETS